MVDEATYGWVRELLADALKSPLLTDDERAFCARMTEQAFNFGHGMALTAEQEQQLLRIEEKIYAHD